MKLLLLSCLVAIAYSKCDCDVAAVAASAAGVTPVVAKVDAVTYADKDKCTIATAAVTAKAKAVRVKTALVPAVLAANAVVGVPSKCESSTATVVSACTAHAAAACACAAQLDGITSTSKCAFTAAVIAVPAAAEQAATNCAWTAVAAEITAITTAFCGTAAGAVDSAGCASGVIGDCTTKKVGGVSTAAACVWHAVRSGVAAVVAGDMVNCNCNQLTAQTAAAAFCGKADGTTDTTCATGTDNCSCWALRVGGVSTAARCVWQAEKKTMTVWKAATQDACENTPKVDAADAVKRFTKDAKGVATTTQCTFAAAAPASTAVVSIFALVAAYLL